MGQIKNIKLHIVTDIKTPKWVHIQQSQKIQPNPARHEAHISECTSRTPEKQLKPSRRCKSFHSEGSAVVSVVKHRPKPMVALKVDGLSSLLNSCCNFSRMQNPMLMSRGLMWTPW